MKIKILLCLLALSCSEPRDKATSYMESAKMFECVASKDSNYKECLCCYHMNNEKCYNGDATSAFITKCQTALGFGLRVHQ